MRLFKKMFRSLKKPKQNFEPLLDELHNTRWLLRLGAFLAAFSLILSTLPQRREVYVVSYDVPTVVSQNQTRTSQFDRVEQSLFDQIEQRVYVGIMATAHEYGSKYAPYSMAAVHMLNHKFKELEKMIDDSYLGPSDQLQLKFLLHVCKLFILLGVDDHNTPPDSQSDVLVDCCLNRFIQYFKRKNIILRGDDVDDQSVEDIDLSVMVRCSMIENIYRKYNALDLLNRKRLRPLLDVWTTLLTFSYSDVNDGLLTAYNVLYRQYKERCRGVLSNASPEVRDVIRYMDLLLRMDKNGIALVSFKL